MAEGMVEGIAREGMAMEGMAEGIAREGMAMAGGRGGNLDKEVMREGRTSENYLRYLSPPLVILPPASPNWQAVSC